jgi:hypothetical protein
MNSYTQHIAEKTLSAKHQVMQLLKWTPQQYADYQYKMGCQYLQAYIPNCPQQIDELVASRIFWNWWKNQWLFRDAAFINSDIVKISDATAIKIYLATNDGDVLAYEIYPSGVVLNICYAEMIADVQKQAIC